MVRHTQKFKNGMIAMIMPFLYAAVFIRSAIMFNHSAAYASILNVLLLLHLPADIMRFFCCFDQPRSSLSILSLASGA